MARLSSYSQSQPKVEDLYLIALAKQGHPEAYDQIVRRYYGLCSKCCVLSNRPYCARTNATRIGYSLIS